MTNRGGNNSAKKMKTEDQGTSTVREATWIRYGVLVWLLSVIIGSSWASLQLMTVFDVRSDLEKLPAITLKLNTVIDTTNIDRKNDKSTTDESHPENTAEDDNKQNNNDKVNTNHAEAQFYEKTSVTIPSIQLARIIASDGADADAVRVQRLKKAIEESNRSLSIREQKLDEINNNLDEKYRQYRDGIEKFRQENAKNISERDELQREIYSIYDEITPKEVQHKRLEQIVTARTGLKDLVFAANPAVQLYHSGLRFGGDEGFGLLINPPEVFIGMPNMMLTLLVSLFMGALGSSIRMMVELVKTNETYNGQWYFLQPFLGALLAFAVFILFKSGHIALSGGGAGSGGELNPYIIAFVAIVSGMLSEKAYRRIGVEGSKFLSEDATPRRVLPTVALAQLKKLGKKPEDLEPFFRTETDVVDLLRGNSTLHPDNQRLVAAWLNVREGDLLTDGKPTVMDRAVFEDLNTATTVRTNRGESSDEQNIYNQRTNEQNTDVSEEGEGGVDDDSDPETIRMLEWVAEDLAEAFPDDLGERLQQAAQSLGEAADNTDAGARKAIVEQSHPMQVIAADVVERLQRAQQQGLTLTFAPATLGCAMASMAAEMPDEMYRRWYARVMDADPAVGAFGPEDYGQLTTPEGTEQGGIEAVMKDIDTLRAQVGDDGPAALDVLVTTATYARQHGLDTGDLPNAFRALGGEIEQRQV